MRQKTPLPRYPLRVATTLLHDEGRLAARAVEEGRLAADDEHDAAARTVFVSPSAGAVATRAGAAVRVVALGSARVSVAVLQRVPVIVATGSAVIAAQWVAVRAFQLILNGRRLRQAHRARDRFRTY